MTGDEKRPRRHSALPPTLPPRGLSRTEAAAYVGVSPTKFDDMVADGRMPKSFNIDARRIWDRHAVDRAFDALATEAVNPWDELLEKSASNAFQAGLDKLLATTKRRPKAK